jgi:hypothetical protein
MAKYIFYLFLGFVALLVIEFFEIYGVPYLELPDWVLGTEEVLQKNVQEAEKID